MSKTTSIEAMVQANAMPWDRLKVLTAILRYSDMTIAGAAKEAGCDFESNDDADSADCARVCRAIHKAAVAANA
jgi:hypothetical protein